MGLGRYTALCEWWELLDDVMLGAMHTMVVTGRPHSMHGMYMLCRAPLNTFPL